MPKEVVQSEAFIQNLNSLSYNWRAKVFNESIRSLYKFI